MDTKMNSNGLEEKNLSKNGYDIGENNAGIQ